MEGYKKWPEILGRYVEEVKPEDYDMPRPTVRRFHGRDIPLWLGKVNYDDIEGYVENRRLRFYLNRWIIGKGEGKRKPSTDDIYEIMLEADNEETRAAKKPFHIQRIADNILRNEIREPIILYCQNGKGPGELWDGNRRFYGLKHIMTEEGEAYKSARDRLRWVPAYVFISTGEEEEDLKIKHDILVECNFVAPEQIDWPSYVKAEEIYKEYVEKMRISPGDSALSREVKDELYKEYGLKGWRSVDRWIKMYDLILQYKEYEEEEKEQDAIEVDLFAQSKFEYFDELSKTKVYASIRDNPEARDKVFDWLWDGKFKAWPDVRYVPKIVADPIAWKQANEPDEDAVRRAINTVIANNPARIKDKSAANEKIKQFAAWLDSFRREEYKTLNEEALDGLQLIVKDAVKITKALLSDEVIVAEEEIEAEEKIEEESAIAEES